MTKSDQDCQLEVYITHIKVQDFLKSIIAKII